MLFCGGKISKRQVIHANQDVLLNYSDKHSILLLRYLAALLCWTTRNSVKAHLPNPISSAVFSIYQGKRIRDKQSTV